MQDHAGLQTAQTACGGSSPKKHSQQKPNRSRPAANAAVIQQQPDLLTEHNELASSQSVAACADVESADAAAISNVGNPTEDAIEAMKAVTIATQVDTSSALASDSSAALYAEGSRSCCCFPDRLIAIHVRSELTESHFDM